MLATRPRRLVMRKGIVTAESDALRRTLGDLVEAGALASARARRPHDLHPRSRRHYAGDRDRHGLRRGTADCYPLSVQVLGSDVYVVWPW